MEFADHTHHVTYNPEVTKPLCRPHHEEITILNGQQARKVRHELSNKHRWWIWFQWLEGKLKVRRTKKALEYIEEWDQRTTIQSESHLGTPEPTELYRTEQIESSAELHAPKKEKAKRKKKTNAAKPRRPPAVRQAKSSRRLERKKKKNR
jgi:hypothetical protein